MTAPENKLTLTRKDFLLSPINHLESHLAHNNSLQMQIHLFLNWMCLSIYIVKFPVYKDTYRLEYGNLKML